MDRNDLLAVPSLIRSAIQERGPLNYAEFMQLALYHPEAGYYTRAVRRSGAGGDFITSVDVGPLFGEMLTVQFVEMWRHLGEPDMLDLVEAGASDGRLAADVMDAAVSDRQFYGAVRLHLVEPSPAARAAHLQVLGLHRSRVVASRATLPGRFTGILYANELLDALPTHVVVMREDGLREVAIDVEGDALVEREVAPTTPRLEEYLAHRSGRLQPGWRTEVNLAAVDWVRAVAARLERGFVLLVDYGHDSATLTVTAHAEGTLRSYRRHVVASSDEQRPPWLLAPGSCDITAHVDLAAVARTAESAGLTVLGLCDQMHFLLGLGIVDRAGRPGGHTRGNINRRLAMKTLLLPDGLGSSHKVLVLGRDVGLPVLRGCVNPFRARVPGGALR